MRLVSAEALAAFYRLELNPAVDGTAEAILLYFAIRHSEQADAAYPSLNRTCKDLSMSRGRVVEAIRRLENSQLIVVKRGAGIRGTNLYKLPWLAVYRRDLGKDGPPIQRQQVGSAGPDRLGESAGPDREGVRWTGKGGQVEPSKSVRSARPKNSKTIKMTTTTHVNNTTHVLL